MARDFDRQVAEFQVRVAVLNGYTALGIPVTKVVGFRRCIVSKWQRLLSKSKFWAMNQDLAIIQIYITMHSFGAREI